MGSDVASRVMHIPSKVPVRAAASGLLALLTSMVLPVAGRVDDAPAKITATAVPGDQRPFQVKGVETSSDGAAATVKLQSERGIFAFHLELTDQKLTSLTLVVEKERYCEGLSFSAKDGKAVDLREASGVSIHPRGPDLAIEIRGKALDTVKGGGRIQFINQYR